MKATKTCVRNWCRPSRDPNPLEGSTRGSSAHCPVDERAATGSRPLPLHGEAVAATAAGNKSLSCTQQKCLLPREPPRSRHRTRLDHKYLHPAGNAAPESRRASPPAPAWYGPDLRSWRYADASNGFGRASLPVLCFKADSHICI